MDYGVTEEGFVIKPLEAIKAEMEADLKANINSKVNLETVSPNGQVLGTLAGQISKAWELAEDVYNAGQTSASGYSLDGVAVLTGTTRSPGTPSTVIVTLNLDAGTTVPIDSRIQVEDSPDSVFRLREEVENAGAVADDFEVEAYSDSYGPVLANAGTLTVILDVVAGWNSVTNAEDADPGTLRESDAQLRAKREEELALGGETPLEAIRADLLQLDGVTAVQVIENDTSATVDSIPPNHIEAIVLGGDDDEIGAAIFASKPPGTGTYGSTTVQILDEQGYQHAVSFTRPSEVDIWIAVTITGADPLSYVGDAAVKQALIDYQESKPSGTDVIRNRLESVVFGLGGLAGVPEADVTILLGLADPPVSGSNISITSRQIADLDTARIDVS